MSHRSWSSKVWHAWFSPRKNSPMRGKSDHFRPLLEVLEDRALPSVSPAHFYNLNGSLADQMGGPELESDGGAFTSTHYVFDANQGLRLSGGLADTSNYSIAFVASVASTDGEIDHFEKLVDFQNRASDDGVYINDSHLQFYPGDAGASTLFANQEFQVVLTRDSASGATLLYLNGVLEQSYSDGVSDAAVPGSNVLTFFEDDTNFGAPEAVAGAVDYIAIYDQALTADEVANLCIPSPSTPPSVSVDQAALAVAEGQVAANTGTYADAVALSASIGTVTPGANGAWSWSFAALDGPGQSQTVTITATNADGVCATTAFEMTVVNLPPEITSLTSSNPTASLTAANGQVSIAGAFTDAGILDTHTVTANWGDGTPIETLTSVDQATGHFAGQHQYTQAGTFTITITVTDDDGGQATQTTTATTTSADVPGVSLVNNVLYVIGSDRKDIIRISLFGGHVPGGPPGATPHPLLRVTTRFGLGSAASGPNRTHVLYFDPADVHHIVVRAGGGNDQVLIDHKVTIDATVFGGAGNDHIRGGGGNDVLVGDEGNDHLDGGQGTNIVIGGGGKDHIVPSRKGHDLRILGSAQHQDDLDALNAAIAAWVAGDEAGALSALGTIVGGTQKHGLG